MSQEQKLPSIMSNKIADMLKDLGKLDLELCNLKRKRNIIPVSNMHTAPDGVPSFSFLIIEG